jgi:hypothetical protein
LYGIEGLRERGEEDWIGFWGVGVLGGVVMSICGVFFIELLLILERFQKIIVILVKFFNDVVIIQ